MNYKFNSAYATQDLLSDYDSKELFQPPLDSPKVRFRNLAVENAEHRQKLLEAVDRVLQNGHLIMGAEVKELESRIAQYCKSKYSIGVSTGTSALYLSLRALGVCEGDEVITTPMSALGTANSIAVIGAKPVFVDVGEDLNINPDAIEASITDKTKAILPVHYTGRMADMTRIIEIAKRHDLKVLEDASQAWGAECALGIAGSIGDLGAISISQMKILNTYGEAGVILCQNKEMQEKLLSLRHLGSVNRELCVDPQLNHKIDTIQAAMGMVDFDYVDAKIKRRLEIAMRYHQGLSEYVICPVPPKDVNDRTCVFFDYTIQTPHRKALKQWMERAGVEVKIRHPLHFGEQPCYREMTENELPVATRLVNEILSLPIHEKLNDDDVDYVIDTARKFFESMDS